MAVAADAARGLPDLRRRRHRQRHPVDRRDDRPAGADGSRLPGADHRTDGVARRRHARRRVPAGRRDRRPRALRVPPTRSRARASWCSSWPRSPCVPACGAADPRPGSAACRIQRSPTRSTPGRPPKPASGATAAEPVPGPAHGNVESRVLWADGRVFPTMPRHAAARRRSRPRRLASLPGVVRQDVEDAIGDREEIDVDMLRPRPCPRPARPHNGRLAHRALES